ncbi:MULTISPECIES: DUF6678 family protein [Shewanella]|uniref:DUF6678 family protein n=1 Tax=Shewanella TaxID=22 RepID=UPI001AAE4E81|nr:DUF6678 family protein [Shewanella algae]EKT4489769.1 hypothetical protein [Shewanella algae]MBO2548728.1 hypothetical protein [Shewanella algae]
MKHPLDYARQKTDRIIQDRFKSFLMNDKKWVKVMKALSHKEEVIKECKVKLVWDDELRNMYLDHAGYCFDYYDHSMEGMISGYPKGYYDYKEIEWLEFPVLANILVNTNNLKSGTKKVAQNISQIHKLISEIGQFEMEINKDYLRLYGYK